MESSLTVSLSIDLNSIYYLPDWVCHPTIIDRPFLFRSDGAEQGRGEWGEVQRRHLWEMGVLKQRDRFARSAKEVRCPRCEAPHPPSHNDFDNDLKNNDLMSNNDTNNDGNDNLNDGTEDTNHNGRIDGDNGDGIYQPESEKWKETSPNEIDSDLDGIDDKTERDNGYNPNKQDTDGDGLTDKEEDKNGNGQYDKENDETNALEIDTDGDGMQDKLELDGWTVCIRFEATGEEKERYTVTSNPREAHSDNDNLNDFDEYKNTTDPNKDDTDGDGKNDYEELNNDFNSSATGIDGEPPEIFHYDCKYKIKKTKLAFVKVPSGLEVWMEVGARDIFGIDNIEIFISGLEDKKIYTDNDDNVTVEFEWTLSGIDEYKRAFFDGFKINVTATDRNGNVGFRNEKLDSIKDIVVSAFLGPLLAIAKFIAELASGIFNWLNGFITNLFETVVQKIDEVLNIVLTFLNSIVEEVIQSINEGYLEDVLSTIMDILTHPIMWVLFAMDIIITIVLLVVSGIPIVTVVSTAISLILLVISMLLMDGQSDEEGEDNLLNKIVSKIFDMPSKEEIESSKYTVGPEIDGEDSEFLFLNVALSVVGIVMSTLTTFGTFILTKTKEVRVPTVVLYLLSLAIFSVSMLINPWASDAWFEDWFFAKVLHFFAALIFFFGYLVDKWNPVDDVGGGLYKGFCKATKIVNFVSLAVSWLFLRLCPAQWIYSDPNNDEEVENYDEKEIKNEPLYYRFDIEINDFTTNVGSQQADQNDFKRLQSPDIILKDIRLKGNNQIIRKNMVGPFLNCDEGENRNVNYENHMVFIDDPKQIYFYFDVFDYDNVRDDKALIPNNDEVNVIKVNGNSNQVRLIYDTESGVVYQNSIDDDNIIEYNQQYGCYIISGDSGICGTITFNLDFRSIG